MSSSESYQAQDPREVYAPDSCPYQTTYPEWTARWWKWVLETPRERNPLLDLTGRYSGENQRYEDVWFLAGSLIGGSQRVERKCQISNSKSILFPVSNNESSFVELPDLQCEAELRAESKADIDKVTRLAAAVDGLVFRESDLKKCRIQSPMFTIDLPKDNILNKRAGPTRAVSDGYWVFLKPLSPGLHNINFLGSCATDDLFIEAVYHLDVK